MPKTYRKFPRISIITITLNAERHLNACLESVASQTYPEMEHILLDGGSKDNTLKIAKNFSRVAIHEGRDSGISDAMNQAARLASGDFLIHLHADDCLASLSVLEKLAITLRQHPDIFWLYGKAQIIDAVGNLKRTQPFFPNAGERLWKYNTLTHPAVIISKAFFEEMGGFSTKWKLAMDYDLWIRMHKTTPPFAYPGLIANFREHEGSLSTSSPLHVAQEAYLIRRQYLKNPWRRFRSYRTFLRRKKECF